MKGDFSKWVSQRKKNYSGVLQQQGRVLLDSDWNAESQIVNDWQDQAGRDVIGACIAAVPADEPDGFKVVNPAKAKAGGAQITVKPGRAWVDGRLVYLDEAEDASRLATYWSPRSGPAPLGPHRDAVILEVWREALNAFQVPDSLIEPALGGPDTTECVLTAMAFRLLRLSANDDCSNLAAKLKDNFAARGKLKVTLQPPVEAVGECPAAASGGYTGFEHRLFRIEIAKADSGAAMFKWSRCNGGLVGRGVFNDDNSKITITANLQPMVLSGLTDFYLEALEYDSDLGRWKVVYGGKATLNADHNLELHDAPLCDDPASPPPAAGASVFLRLWDGILPISDYSGAEPKELKDGIFLNFDVPNSASAIYRPEDYWTFPVRAGEIVNPETLVGHADGGAPPDGVHFHRAPLAILNWPATPQALPDIDDCRRIFRPLTQQKVCCTWIVGDGVSSHGDFDSIEEALEQLPQSGGEICLLPGTHETNALIQDRQNVTIRGCDRLTRVVPRAQKRGSPIFTIQDSQKVTIESLEIVALTGIAIDLIETADVKNRKRGELREITIRQNRIMAYQHALRVRGGSDIAIRDNKIRMLDREGGDVAIYLAAEDSAIERNDVRMVTIRELPKPEAPVKPHDFDPLDPCADFAKLDFRQPAFIALLRNIWINYGVNLLPKGFTAPGGIQIAGASERIKISENRIIGGAGNGVTLGHWPDLKQPDWDKEKDQIRKNYSAASLPAATLKPLQAQFESFIYELHIVGNEIALLGLNGIGVIGFLNSTRIRLSVSLLDSTIAGNHIHHCLQQMPAEIHSTMRNQMGFGGISLSDADNLIIRENRIEYNGKTHLDPVCGVFIRSGEKIEIADNRIVHNAPRVSEEDDGARPGRRGGIVILFGVQRLGAFRGASEANYYDHEPAVKVHNNTVIQPLGQALIIAALGPVAVAGNSFSSQGIAGKVDPLSQLAGSVLILDLGMAQDLLTRMRIPQIGGYRARAQLSYYAAPANPINTSSITAPNLPSGVLAPYKQLPGGSVLFNDNKVLLDLRSGETSRALCSQAIVSLDDISYCSNQSECAAAVSLSRQSMRTPSDSLVTDVFLYGVSIRSNDCRFQEGIEIGTISLLSLGLLMNTCTGNQATHCLIVQGSAPRKIENSNLILLDSVCRQHFDVIQTHIYGLAAQKGAGTKSNLTFMR